jgi:hypothetical protein
MATINLGRIKPVWKNTWTATTAYVVDDIVRSGRASYICINAHTSAATFAIGSDWALFADGGVDGTTVGTGSAGQVLKTNSSGNGTEWTTLAGFSELSDSGITFDTCGAEGPAGPSNNAIAERYAGMSTLNSTNLNVRGNNLGCQLITIKDTGRYFFKLAGAAGGGKGGHGGLAWGQLDITAGTDVYLYVGHMGNVGQSTNSNSPITEPEHTNFIGGYSGNGNIQSEGGFGYAKGGRSGGTGTGWAGSGGGSTEVIINSNRMIVAGGGGGTYIEDYNNTTNHAHGGDGGGWVGTVGEGNGDGNMDRLGEGGSQTAGGPAGVGGNAGTATQGANGPSNDGGGGGGGYWGGSTGTNAGGGGGSGYVGGMISSLRGMSIGGNYGHGWIYIRRMS